MIILERYKFTVQIAAAPPLLIHLRDEGGGVEAAVSFEKFLKLYDWEAQHRG